MGDPQRVSTAARAGESAFARFVERGGRLALWPALYVAGVAFFLSDVSGLPLPTPAYACAFGCTLGSYLLDRVKLGDRWLDPADAPGHEQRRALLRAQAGSLRLVALAALGGGALAGWLVHPLAGALPLASAVGVTLYTVRRPLTTPGRRIKDRLILKNAAVAFSIVALGAALLALARLGAEGAPPLDPARIAVALGAATLFVGSDAALCDVPDAQLDRAHATRTIPVVFGRRATRGRLGGLRREPGGQLSRRFHERIGIDR